MHVINAEFRRVGLSGEQQFGEVEVRVEGIEQPLIAVFRRKEDGRLVLHNVNASDESFVIDWYENPIHQAQTSVTDQLFAGETEADRWEKREAFVQQVLAYDDVRDRLEMSLDEMGVSAL